MHNLIEKHWRKLSYTAFVIIGISILILIYNLIATGSFIEMGLDFEGGKRITFPADNLDFQNIRESFSEYNVSISTGTTNTISIQTSYSTDENVIFSKLSTLGINDYNLQSIGPLVGNIFWTQTQIALIASFIMMSLIVFVLFRSKIPSLLVILAVLTDIVGTVAVLSILQIEMSLGVLAALLMLIGYSVDTDILLTSSIIKFKTSLESTIKTGLTMSITTLTALTALYLITSSIILKTIAIVLIIGILIDITGYMVNKFRISENVDGG